MKISFCICAWLMLAAASFASPTYLGPSPYLSFSDSPFNGGSFSYFHLKDFEDGTMASPGVTFTSGLSILSPGSLTDSVDGDDGSVDGAGNNGHSLYSNLATNQMTFTFDATALGGFLPTHAGMVWTDAGNVTSGSFGVGVVSFEAFGSGMVSLGSIGPFTLGDGTIGGATAEDRFFGVTDLNGISAIRITTANSTDWEVDHLQYGRATSAPISVPEPASAWLICGAVVAFAARRVGSRGKN